ncbi:MAG TPA: hypothetical protein VGG80_07550 [Acidobacteriaceae bacterium]
MSRRSFFGRRLECAVMECSCGLQERVIRVRLPSYGIGYEINTDTERWGQRVLCYHGHSGFSIQWWFEPMTVSHEITHG